MIDIYRKSAGKSNGQIDAELSQLSDALVRRANKFGITHDEKFRNLNGMKLMLQNVIYIATDGQQGMSSTSSSMRKVYRLLNSAPDVFDLILDEFQKRYVVTMG